MPYNRNTLYYCYSCLLKGDTKYHQAQNDNNRANREAPMESVGS